MQEFLGTLPGGLVTGAVYALLAMGLVFTYKATRVPNFAYGAIATFIAFFHYDLVAGRTFGVHLDLLVLHVDVDRHVQLPFWGAVPVSLGVAALVGLAVERVVIRPFARARAPMVVLIIVTLGLALLLSALTQQLFGADQLIVPNDQAIFARTPAFAIGGVNVSWERFGVFALLVVLAAGTWWFFRATRTGLAIRASATDPDVAALLGVSARKLAVVSWVSGSMVAGVAGIALASVVVSSDPNLLLLLTIKGFAAAIVGGMVSFPIAVAAALGLGLGEEWTRHYLVALDPKVWQGAPEVLTLGAVIVVLALRPRWIFTGIREDEDTGVVGRGGADSALARAVDPVEAYRLVVAAVPSGLRRWAGWRRLRRAVAPAAVALVVLFPVLPFVPDFYTLPANLALAEGLVLLSFVVLVGWLGQVSLAQGAFVAIGGAGAAIGANTLHLPFPLPILCGVLLSLPASVLIGLPALRLRGLHLAVATLAFGLAAERAVVPRFATGTYRVAPPSWMDSDRARYWVFLTLVAAAVWAARRMAATRVGRSFAAIRDSEVVAAAYGIRPVRVKLTGFAVSGAIAALAGTLFTYQLGAVGTQQASVFFSITWLANAVVAGIGSIAGPAIGAFFFGLYPELTRGEVQATSLSFWPQITASALLLLVMAVNPGGLASMARFVRSRASAHDDTGEVDLSAVASDAVEELDELDAADGTGGELLGAAHGTGGDGGAGDELVAR
jgi:branched-chain amino acid transport system permease protein